MSNTKKSDQEPSIEEILESIRQIISDDDGDAQDSAEADKSTATAAAFADDGEDDILDLTDTVDDDHDIDMVERAVEPVAEAVPQPVVEPEPVAAEPAPVEQPRIEQPLVMDEAPMTANDPNSLLSAEVAEVATAELSKLMTGNLSVERDQVGQPGKVTLEDMALQLMRPLLKEWLDQNLPAIVEKAVQREVEKLSRRVGG